MAEVQGVACTGPTQVGSVDKGRKLAIGFAGADGKTYTVFIPHDTASVLIELLMEAGARARRAREQAGIEPKALGTPLADPMVIPNASFSLLAEANRPDYLLQIGVGDLVTRYRLPLDGLEAIATAALSILQKEGRQPSLTPEPGKPKH